MLVICIVTQQKINIDRLNVFRSIDTEFSFLDLMEFFETRADAKTRLSGTSRTIYVSPFSTTAVRFAQLAPSKFISALFVSSHNTREMSWCFFEHIQYNRRNYYN